MQRGHVALRVEAGGQLALRDRVVAAVLHVFFARPDQLDRRARHLLGDRHRLAHPVVHCAAPAEAAAEQQLVDLALREPAGPRLRRRRRAPPRRSASASRPRSAPASSAPSRSSAPSSRGSGADTNTPPRSCAAPPASAALASPAWLPTTASWRVEAGLQHCGDARRSRRCGVRAVVPFDRQRVERASWRATRCRRRPRPRCRRRARPSSRPGVLRSRRGIEALHLAAERPGSP